VTIDSIVLYMYCIILYCIVLYLEHAASCKPSKLFHCLRNVHILGSLIKLHVSGNGKRQVRTFLAKFSLNVFVSYFLSCVERIIMYFTFKTASLFTLYCLIYTVNCFFAWRLPRITQSLYKYCMRHCNWCIPITAWFSFDYIGPIRLLCFVHGCGLKPQFYILVNFKLVVYYIEFLTH
jgi:hypothetical protein